MAATATYRIGDEPLPGPLQHLVVNPVWPLLAVMLGGVWLSWPWFVLNGFAVGSPTRRRELAVAVAGLAVSVLLVAIVVYLVGAGILGRADARYALVGVTAWKLAVCYWLYTLQTRSFGLYQYFGGKVRNGLWVVLAALFLAAAVLGRLPPFLQMVLS
jgi:hypothetical protein